MSLLYTEISNSFLIGRKRLYNYHVKDTQGHGLSFHVWPQCMISEGNHVNFARFELLPVSEEAKTWLPFFFIQCIIKQLLDSVLVISRIMKVEVRVSSRSRRLRLITVTSTLIILDITKTSSNNCLLTVSLYGGFSSLRRRRQLPPVNFRLQFSSAYHCFFSKRHVFLTVDFT